jgi:hypothetical protein
VHLYEKTKWHIFQAMEIKKSCGGFLEQGFWRGNVPALLLVMPYTAIQFVVIQKFKTLVSGSPREGFMSYHPVCEELKQARIESFFLSVEFFILS